MLPIPLARGSPDSVWTVCVVGAELEGKISGRRIPGCFESSGLHGSDWFGADTVRRRSERLPSPCSWVDTIAEVGEHRSASHAFLVMSQ